MQRTSAAAFEGWRKHSLKQKRMEDVSFKVIKHMMNRSLSMAFDTWQEHALDQARMRGILERCICVCVCVFVRACALASECVRPDQGLGIKEEEEE